MKVKKESPVQIVDPRRRLHKVTLDQTRFLHMTSDDKPTGLRTDGVTTCLVLCGLIKTNTIVLFGMQHWSGSEADSTEEKQADAARTFKTFCSKLRKEAKKLNIEETTPLEIILIGGEKKTENVSGTEAEQAGLISCLNQEISKKYGINLNESSAHFNLKTLDDSRASIYLTTEGVSFKEYQGGDTESAAYSSASNSDSPAKIKAELKEVKAELKALKDSQKELKNSQEEQREAQRIFQEEVLKRLRPSNFFQAPPTEEAPETREPAPKRQKTLGQRPEEEQKNLFKISYIDFGTQSFVISKKQ